MTTQAATIENLLKEWHLVRNQINEDNPDEATEARLYVELDALEKAIHALPSRTAADLAAKYEVLTDCNTLETNEQFYGECMALLRLGQVAGVSAHG